MSPGIATAPVPNDAAPLLLEPWGRLSDEQLLAHYRQRTGVQWFVVADPRETAPERIDAICAGRFEFNGEVHELGRDVAWLRNPSADVEWHILLHKFYYAVGLAQAWSRTGDARYVARWAELIEQWVAVTPPGFIAVDVAGRRIQNWIYSLHELLRGARPAPVDARFFRMMLASLEQQVEHTCNNLTAKRNHRTLELYAVFLAAVVFPEFAHSARWRALALRELAANVAADLLPDGVHCELSTDYHHLVLRNYLCVLRLAALNGIDAPAGLRSGVERALEFSMHAHKPDGVVPSFSDGDARGFLELLETGASLFGRDDFRYVAAAGEAGRAPSRRLAVFADSGYVIARSGWGQGALAWRDEHHLLFDCGPLGEGNHGHFDCLSFELAAHGRSLIVDPGRYTYSEAGDVNWRVWFRSTAAHNTVCVDGRNQTRYAPRAIGGGSRHAAGSVRHKIAGPAPVASLLRADDDGNRIWLAGTARSAEYDAVHTRHLVLVDGCYWLLVDQLRAPTCHAYTQRLQLHPVAEAAVTIERAGSFTRVSSPGLTLAYAAGTELAVEPGWVSFDYGQRERAPALCARQQAADACFVVVLWPGQPPAALQLTARHHDGAVDVRVRRDRDQVDCFSFPDTVAT